jgi:hypothetical protein
VSASLCRKYFLSSSWVWLLGACSAAPKDSRVDHTAPISRVGEADAGGRTNPRNPSPQTSELPGESPTKTPVSAGTPLSGSPTPVATATPPTQTAATGGKCALAEAQRPQISCGPYTPERRALCHAFSSNPALCIEESPADGWAKDFYDRLGVRLKEHTTTTMHQRTLPPASCSSGRFVIALPVVRLLADAQEAASVTEANVAALGATEGSVTVLELWGYWARVRVASKEGWVAKKAVHCL